VKDHFTIPVPNSYVASLAANVVDGHQAISTTGADSELNRGH
jgi:hypothetical protein